MPVKYELTWIASRQRWRKRYAGHTHYLKTRTNGKRDREGYKKALREWERLKAHLDGCGPCPYSPETGAILPECDLLPDATRRVATKSPPSERLRQLPELISDSIPDNPFIIGSGFYPELQVKSVDVAIYAGERGIHPLAKAWHDARKNDADRGELSLRQWADDKAKLNVFRNFLLANFVGLKTVDEITPQILNLYRETQWKFVDHADPELSIGRATLKKRLDCVSKWITWLVDQNILAESPKDLKAYGKVKLEKPTPLFWTAPEIKTLASAATLRTSLYIRLALNLGYTQKDIATLSASMIDFKTGIVTRDRQKTGVPSKAILWPSTLNLLREESTLRHSGPLLRAENGSELYVERINDNGKLVVNDTIRMAFDRLKARKTLGFAGDKRSFKHLRKTAANEIEKRDPTLTPLFLAHSEQGVKRHYVDTHYDRLFEAVLELEGVLLAS